MKTKDGEGKISFQRRKFFPLNFIGGQIHWDYFNVKNLCEGELFSSEPCVKQTILFEPGFYSLKTIHEKITSTLTNEEDWSVKLCINPSGYCFLTVCNINMVLPKEIFKILGFRGSKESPKFRTFKGGVFKSEDKVDLLQELKFLKIRINELNSEHIVSVDPTSLLKFESQNFKIMQPFYVTIDELTVTISGDKDQKVGDVTLNFSFNAIIF